MSVAKFATAAALAVLFALPASAAATHGSQQSEPQGRNQRDPGGPNSIVQCYPTAVAYKANCVAPPVVNTKSDTCYCSEIRVKTAMGTIVKKVRCTDYRVEQIRQVKVVAENCNAIRRLPNVYK